VAGSCWVGTWKAPALPKEKSFDELVAELKKLLTEKELTFQKAIDMVKTHERAAAEARQLQNPTGAGGSNHPVSSVGKVSHGNGGCKRCGKANHEPAQCPFKSARCHNCGKVGHIRKVCRQPLKNSNQNPNCKRGERSTKAVLEGTEPQKEGLLNHLKAHP